MNRILLKSAKKSLIQIVKESSLEVNIKTSLIDFLKERSDAGIANLLIFLENKPSKKVRRYQLLLKMQALAKNASIPLAMTMPGGLETLTALTYIKDKYNYSCQLKCVRKNKWDRLEYHRCNVRSIKKLLNDLEFNVNHCVSHDNPQECKQKIYHQIGVWKGRLIDSERKLEKYVQKHRDKK